MNNFENIDDYLANRLKGNEKAEFEAQLGQDPALKSEVELQKQIVEGIRQARAAELKAMLSKVSVAGGGAQTEFSVLRIAAGVAIAGVITAATIYYLRSNDFPPIENAAADVTKKEEIKPQETQPEATAPQKDEEEKSATSAEEKKSEKKESASEEIKPAVKPSLDLADPSSELSEENRPTDETPASNSRPEIAPSHVQVEMDSSNKKYDFHYQFRDSKLMLYGSFDRSLYEVLEINTGDHALFLYYKNNFYLIEESQEKITKLTPIKDQELIRRLREYRSK
jgi:hypothetical protein